MTLLTRLRRFWLDVHLWIGVGLLVAVIPISVTGSALVWHDQLDRALYSDRYAVSGPQVAQPVATYAATAVDAFAGRATLTQVRLPEHAGDPVVAVGRLDGPPAPNGRPRTLNAWIDPPTGKLLATGDTAQTVTQVMHRLHGSLMIPQIGRKVVGWIGWAMFVSCLTGLWLWWPRNGAFLKALRWRRGASQLFNLHHMVGFWICLPLAVLSLTGVYISFPQTARAMIGLPPQPPRPNRAQPPPVEAPRLTVDQAVAAALAAQPGGTVMRLDTPTEGKTPAWRIELKGESRPQTLEVVDATGEAKASRGGGGGPGAGRDPTARLMRQIHDGADTGIVWQTIIFLGGIAPAVLSITGLIMWLRRRARRQALHKLQTQLAE